MIIVDAVFISAGPHNPRIIPIQADHAILAQTRLVKRVISYITHPVQTFIQDIDTAHDRFYHEVHCQSHDQDTHYRVDQYRCQLFNGIGKLIADLRSPRIR